jgi:hypothetical protein
MEIIKKEALRVERLNDVSQRIGERLHRLVLALQHK